MYKTAMCPHLDRWGTCTYGDACIFAHDPTEMRKPPRHTKYKTTRCNKFYLGYCPYGTRCQFIHDEVDAAPAFVPAPAPAPAHAPAPAPAAPAPAPAPAPRRVPAPVPTETKTRGTSELTKKGARVRHTRRGGRRGSSRAVEALAAVKSVTIPIEERFKFDWTWMPMMPKTERTDPSSGDEACAAELHARVMRLLEALLRDE